MLKFSFYRFYSDDTGVKLEPLGKEGLEVRGLPDVIGKLATIFEFLAIIIVKLHVLLCDCNYMMLYGTV